MRGKLSAYSIAGARRRIIPARAGQTNRVAVISDMPLGSSPRVRGKLEACRSGDHAGRIIPARAGQTCPCGKADYCHPDHPRACGANSANGTNAVSHFGSSPRVRGKRQRTDRKERQQRIIPARAGQTDIHGRQQRFRSDHPRACGANFDAA